MLIFIVVVAIMIILLLSAGTDQGAKYVYKNNIKYQQIKMKPKEYQCSECSMDIENLAYAAQIILKNGDTYFFDEIGCVILWLQTHQVDKIKILTKTLDTKKWVKAEKAWYTRIASTPMGYGFASNEYQLKDNIAYDKMKILMLQGQNLHDPFVKKNLLGK